MFFNTNRPSNVIGSLIGAGTRIEGDVFFGGGLRLDGSVHGNVRALPGQSGTLVVGKTGRIDGEVAAPHVVVNGTINGQVIGFETLELRSSARVSGDVYYGLMDVRQGAIVEGQLANRAVVNSKQAAELDAAFSG